MLQLRTGHCFLLDCKTGVAVFEATVSYVPLLSSVHPHRDPRRALRLHPPPPLLLYITVTPGGFMHKTGHGAPHPHAFNQQ